MPIYEFFCPNCGKRESLFLRHIGSPPTPSCPSCGHKQMTRLFSPFAYHKSVKDVHEWSGEPDRPGPDYYKDPRNIGRWVEKKFKEFGVEMPSQVKDMIQAAREGELPGPVKELQPGRKEI